MVSIYRSPSQTQGDFDGFFIQSEAKNSHAITKYPLFIPLIGDINAGEIN